MPCTFQVKDDHISGTQKPVSTVQQREICLFDGDYRNESVQMTSYPDSHCQPLCLPQCCTADDKTRNLAIWEWVPFKIDSNFERKEKTKTAWEGLHSNFEQNCSLPTPDQLLGHSAGSATTSVFFLTLYPVSRTRMHDLLEKWQGDPAGDNPVVGAQDQPHSSCQW